jgi:DNA-directed RNA polymerase subunit RPC12/RpoP
MPFLPCLLCGRKLEKRTSKKNGKPYFVCDPCGIQLFIRKKQGIELLEETFHNLEKAQIPFRIHADNLYEIQAQIKEIDGIKAEIEKLGISYFFNDQKLRIRNSLKTQLDNLLLELEHMTKEEEKEEKRKS